MFLIFIIFIFVLGWLIHRVNDLETRIERSENEITKYREINADLYRKVNYLYSIVRNTGAPPNKSKHSAPQTASGIRNDPKTVSSPISSTSVSLEKHSEQSSSENNSADNIKSSNKRNISINKNIPSVAAVRSADANNLSINKPAAVTVSKSDPHAKIESIEKAAEQPAAENAATASVVKSDSHAKIESIEKAAEQPAAENAVTASIVKSDPHAKVESIEKLAEQPAAEIAATAPVVKSDPHAKVESKEKSFADQTQHTVSPYSQVISDASRFNKPYQAAPEVSPLTQSKTSENWIGGQLFSIIASIMIFIGLILFCTLGTDVVSNGAKSAVLFAVSCGFIGAGAGLSKSDKTAFPKALIGCGFGTFFITTLVSHIIFGILNEIAAFGFILIWSCAALYMSKRLSSVSLSVIAHAGTAISIAFGYTTLYSSPEKLVLLSLYQIAALAVIILGNIFFCRKTYRFGLIMSQLLLLYTSIAMGMSLPNENDVFGLSVIIVLYVIQILAIFFVSYLVAISTNSLEKDAVTIFSSASTAELENVIELKQKAERLDAMSTLIHIVNKFLWFGSTVITAGAITFHILDKMNADHQEVKAAAVLLILFLLHLFVTLLINSKLDFSEKLTVKSVAMISLFISGTMIYGSVEWSTPFIFAYVLLLAVIAKKTKLPVITKIASAALGFEAVFMTFVGFFEIENIKISIPYMCAIAVTAFVLWFIMDGPSKQKYFARLKLAEYIWLSVSIITINLSVYGANSKALMIIEISLLNLICFFIKFTNKKETALYYIVKITSVLNIYSGIIALSNLVNAEGHISVTKMIMVIMVTVITAVFSIDFAKSRHTLLNLLSCFTASAYTAMLSVGLDNKFFLFKLYSDLLEMTPFFLVFAVCAAAIYWFKKNDTLRLFIWGGMAINVVYMICIGYSELIDISQIFENGYRLSDIEKTPLFIIGGLASIAHASIILTLILMLKERGEEKGLLNILPKYALYIWVNISYSVIIYQLLSAMKLTGYPIVASMIVLSAINLFIYIFKMQGEYHSVYNYMVSISCAVIFFISLIQIAVRQQPNSNIGFMFTKTALVLLTVGLYFIRTKEILLHRRDTLTLILIGTAITALTNAICSCYNSNFDFFAIFSIITMLTALICVIVGFKLPSKGLRIYGLVIVLLCIIKLVTIDIIGENSLTRVIAFIGGGMICFIISAIYSRIESAALQKSIGKSHEEITNTDNITVSK